MGIAETFSLELLMRYKDNSRLEIKSAHGGLPSSLWESYSAFTNREGGVVSTTLILDFEGRQPDIEAMKLLYDYPDELIKVDNAQESEVEMGSNLGSSPVSKGECELIHYKSHNSSLENPMDSLFGSSEFARSS